LRTALIEWCGKPRVAAAAAVLFANIEWVSLPLKIKLACLH
jgi:hypothetical protein